MSIFEQKTDKDMLKNNEELYSSAFEITGDGFSIIQPIVDNNGKLCDYKYLYVNDEYERQTGLKAAAVVGKNAKQLFSKLEPLWSEMYDNFIRTGKPTWYENYGSFTKRWFNLLVFSVGEGKIGILFRDITERKKTEERLKENKERLETAQRVAHVGSWDYFIKTDEAVWSKELYHIFGIKPTRKAPNMQEYRKLIDPDYLNDLDLRMQKFFAEGKLGDIISFDYCITRPNGSIRYLHTERLIREVDENGKPKQITGIEQDITERKKAEEALRQSEERFKLVAEVAKVLVYEVNLEQTNITIYRGEDVLGYNPGEIPGKTEWWLSQIHPDDRAKIESTFRTAIQEGKDYGLEYRIKCKQGRYITAHDTGKTITNQEGKVIKFVGGMRDITERKKAEEALRKSEDEYSSLFANMIDGFAYCQMIFDDAGKPTDFVYLQINDEFERITGLKRDVVVGKKVTEAIPGIKEANPELFEIYGRVASTCQKEKFEVFFKPLRLWLSISVYCPKKGYFAAIFEDITAHKAAEEEVLESEKRLNRSQEIAHLGSWELDLTNNKLSWSDEVYRIFGLKPQEFGATYEAFLQAVHPDDRKAVDDAYSGSLREGKDTYEIEHRVVRKSTGEIRIVHEKSEHIRDENGKIIRSIGMVQDITERKILEAKLEEYSKNLEKLVEERTKQLKDAERLAAIGATAGMVGHDIRNPLQAMISDVYLIKDELASSPECKTKEGIVESIDSIEKNVCYVNKIVADLQDYSRVLKPEMTNIVDLCPVVKEIVDSIIIPSNISVSLTCSVKRHSIKLELTYLKRILTNLVTNAVQAMPNGGRLTIDNYERDGKLFFTVGDTGAGIPEEVKPQLFKPLMTTKSKGQGLGLAVVKRLVEAQNGTITFESQEGKGTKFIIELPAQG